MKRIAVSWRRRDPNSVLIPCICPDSPRHCQMSVCRVTFSKSQLWVQAQKAYYYENLPPKFISHSSSGWGLYPAESHYGCFNLNSVCSNRGANYICLQTNVPFFWELRPYGTERVYLFFWQRPLEMCIAEEFWLIFCVYKMCGNLG